MASNVVDKRDLLVQVIRALEPVRRAHRGETSEQWSHEVEPALECARDLLGAYGEGKALTKVVALCTQLLEWHDLSEVGVQPTSEPPWKVLLADLLDLDEWSDGVRRTRALKILRKLSHHLSSLAAEAVEGAVTIIDFCGERGVIAGTLRGRLRRHNERRRDAVIRPIGLRDDQRLLYSRDDLVELLTDDERARCR